MRAMQKPGGSASTLALVPGSSCPPAACRGLAWALQEALGVRHVWSDTRSEHSSQRFVLWAGAVLEHRAELEAVLQVGRPSLPCPAAPGVLKAFRWLQPKRGHCCWLLRPTYLRCGLPGEGRRGGVNRRAGRLACA